MGKSPVRRKDINPGGFFMSIFCPHWIPFGVFPEDELVRQRGVLTGAVGVPYLGGELDVLCRDKISESGIAS